MKKVLLKVIIIIILIGLAMMGIDYYRVTKGELPIFNHQSYQSKERVQTFQGLFYVMKRKVRSSVNEPLSESSDIHFKAFFIAELSVPDLMKPDSFLMKVSTKKSSTCTSKLYFANLDIKVYLYCLDEVTLQKEQKDTLANYLANDITILDEMKNYLYYSGIMEDGSSEEYKSRDDGFAEDGLTMIRCNQLNINDVYIGPKDITFQTDFCTYKDDDFQYIYDVVDESTPPEAQKNEKGEIIAPPVEVFYEDSNYRYQFSYPKSDFVFVTTPEVRGKMATKIPVKVAMANGLVTIEDLEKKQLKFDKIDKKKELDDKKTQ